MKDINFIKNYIKNIHKVTKFSNEIALKILQTKKIMKEAKKEKIIL